MSLFQLPVDNIQHTTYHLSMIRTQVYIPDKTYHRAKTVAAMTNRTISQLMREGLELVIAQPRRQQGETSGQYMMKHFVGKGKGKKGVNAAINHNDIYTIC